MQFSLELSFQGSTHKDPIAVDLARNDPAPHFRRAPLSQSLLPPSHLGLFHALLPLARRQLSETNDC